MAADEQPGSKAVVPRHIAVIMDGNGRWARRRGLPRLAGHRAGTENIRRIVEECTKHGVGYLTLYAFSTENWQRPSREVNGLMTILSEFIDRETHNLHRNGVQIRHLGRLDGLSAHLARKVRQAIDLTHRNERMVLAVAFNYGGRTDLVDAVRELAALGIPMHEVTEELISAHLSTRGMPDPDLIIRTSGEWRISNFLIWQSAYSEYWTSPVFWPEFGPDQLRQAILDYGQRERRFGALPEEI